MDEPPNDRELFGDLVEDFLNQLRRGSQPSIEDYAQRFPEWAEEIRDAFPALLFLESIKEKGSGNDHEATVDVYGKKLERIGEYRILREIGRGGMGIVFEAEQESLGRRVALKILPMQPHLQSEQLERFRREPRTTARLHHTNIVPVYSVGEWEGFCYYAMQFIWGLGLDEILADLRTLEKGGPPRQEPRSEAELIRCQTSTFILERLLKGAFQDPLVETASTVGAPPGQEASCSVSVPAGSRSRSGVESTEVALPGLSRTLDLPAQTAEYFRSVARIGLQVADALAYAHSQDTLHRDIKPSNLILDTRGTIWLTDFGLAKTAFDSDLTLSGNLVGTLRYMAPERFQGKSDARCDIYSLGLTLHELITLKPAFEAASRDELIEQVTTASPTIAPSVREALPRDLETIIRKTIERDPANRYQTARELAEDLRNFLEGRPILARRPSSIELLRKWCRRNPLVASLTAAVAVLILALAVGSSYMVLRLSKEKELFVAESQRAETAEMERGMGLVDAALTAVPETLPHILESLESWENRERALPALRAKLEDSTVRPLLKLRAGIALTILGQAQADLLLRAIADAPAREGLNLVLAFRRMPSQVHQRLRKLAESERSPSLKARAAIILLELGDASLARAMLAFREDPVLRTTLIHELESWHGDFAFLPQLLETEDDPALRSGICAALGTIEYEAIPQDSQQPLVAILSRLCVEDPSGVTHSMASWALQRWGVVLPEIQPAVDSPENREWFTNDLGMTFVKVPAGISEQGDSDVPYANPRVVYISRPFFMLDREVTVRLFDLFMQDETRVQAAKPLGWRNDTSWSPSPDCPAQNVTWEEAVQFSNWLSWREGRKPCYVQTEAGEWRCDFEANGYRLPTEAEWEHACRAGSTTPFAMGSNIDSLLSYCNTGLRRLSPAGARLPNDLGVFGLLGNVWEWCWDGYASSPARFSVDPSGQENNKDRVLRGGCLESGISDFKSARRYHADRSQRDPTTGFRVVLCVEKRSWEDVVAALRHFAAKSPMGVPGLWEALYRWYAQHGDTSGGAVALEKALREFPTDAGLRTEYARALADSCRWKESAREFHMAAESGEGSVHSWFQGHWWVSGPYPESLVTAFPPESVPDHCADPAPDSELLPWRPAFQAEDGLLHLDGLFGYAEHISAYALTYVYSTDSRYLLLLIGSDDQVRLWLNGELCHEHPDPRQLEPGQDRVLVQLRPGWNRLLFKVVNLTDDHKLQLQTSQDPVVCAKALARKGLKEPAKDLLKQAMDQAGDNPEIEREYHQLLASMHIKDREGIEASARSSASGVAQAEWWVVGPYPPRLNAEYSPESQLDPSLPVPSAGEKDLEWQHAVAVDEHTLHLDDIFHGAADISAYALTWIFSVEEKQAVFLVGSDDQVRIWLNGELVHEFDKPRLLVPDDDLVPVKLRQGWNTILAKVVNGTAQHKLYFKVAVDPGLLAAAALQDGPRGKTPHERDADFWANDPKLWIDHGQDMAEQGKWVEARKAFEKALELDQQANVAYSLALVRLALEDTAGHATTCQDLLLRLQLTQASPQNAALALWVTSLSNNPKIPRRPLVRLTESLHARGSDDPFVLTALGAALYRSGKAKQAIGLLEQANSKLEEGHHLSACACFFLALAHRELGTMVEARQWLEKARAWVAATLSPEEGRVAAEPTLPPLSWDQRLPVELLAGQAKQAFVASPKHE